MFSTLFSLRPNPRYVPGGTENFWVTANSSPQERTGESGGGMVSLGGQEKVTRPDEATKIKTGQYQLGNFGVAERSAIFKFQQQAF